MTTDTVGGVWAYSMELCKALQKHKVKVHLAAMGNWPSKAQQGEAEKLENVLLYKSDYKLEWMQDPWEDVQEAGKWLNSISETLHPDVIHFNNYAHMGKGWSCPTITVFHSCVQTWWQAVKGTDFPNTWNRYLEILQSSLNYSDVVVAPTQTIMEKIKANYEITAPCEVIYNGIDQSSFQPLEKKEFILCVGRIWDEGKNLLSLSGIAKTLPWPVYVVGNNINPNTGERIEIRNVNFLGNLSPEETREWLMRASIFISPTKYEPFGLSILQAAAAGCALVLNELDTLKELWNDTAIFFDPNDRTEAKKIILDLIEHKSFREEVSEKARVRAANFSAEKMAENYVNLYREIIENKKIKEEEEEFVTVRNQINRNNL